MTEPRFEEAMSRLEELVKRLEGGDLSLDESLEVFEEGIKLSRWCIKKLEEAERKVEVLLKTEAGELEVKPLDFTEELGELYNG
ncbi:MAG: exodeoxyribonuclease VII small subunit [Nitrospinae bacterium RIFCSPLOWO2_12_FULL_45_22]|nr:MAG: exodeoxyribonuclease VII small subunit [Nitrospinae bacterium RIFCSPLOWO2_12_FULL_45_22]